MPLLSGSSVEIRDDLRDGINRALNEADLLGLSVADDGSEATIVVRVLTLPADRPEPEDRVRYLRCSPIARVTASLRHGLWNDETARVEPLTLDQFSAVVESPVVRRFTFVDCGNRHCDCPLLRSISRSSTVVPHRSSQEAFVMRPLSPQKKVSRDIWCCRSSVLAAPPEHP